jgi:hypothetical protein
MLVRGGRSLRKLSIGYSEMHEECHFWALEENVKKISDLDFALQLDKLELIPNVLSRLTSLTVSAVFIGNLDHSEDLLIEFAEFISRK